MLKLSRFVTVPLNAKELLLPGQGAELQQFVSFYLIQVCTENINVYIQTGVR